MHMYIVSMHACMYLPSKYVCMQVGTYSYAHMYVCMYLRMHGTYVCKLKHALNSIKLLAIKYIVYCIGACMYTCND